MSNETSRTINSSSHIQFKLIDKNQEIQSGSKQHQAYTSLRGSDPTPSADGQIAKPLPSLMMSWAILGNVVVISFWIGLSAILWKKTNANAKNNNAITALIPKAYRIPCRNCKFYANNHYLKCAVRPFDVLSERALNCEDFCSAHDPKALELMTQSTSRLRN